MTIPALLFGCLVAIFMGAAFHLWKGEGFGRLLLYLILAVIGFWIGHFIAAQFAWGFLMIGPLRFGPAVISCAVTIGVGHWFSLVKKEVR